MAHAKGKVSFWRPHDRTLPVEDALDDRVTDVTTQGESAPEPVRREQAERLLRTWKTPEGWRYFSAVNNTEVGVWYAAMSFAFFLFAGVLALLMRVQLAVP